MKFMSSKPTKQSSNGHIRTTISLEVLRKIRKHSSVAVCLYLELFSLVTVQVVDPKDSSKRIGILRGGHVFTNLELSELTQFTPKSLKLAKKQLAKEGLLIVSEIEGVGCKMALRECLKWSDRRGKLADISTYPWIPMPKKGQSAVPRPIVGPGDGLNGTGSMPKWDRVDALMGPGGVPNGTGSLDNWPPNPNIHNGLDEGLAPESKAESKAERECEREGERETADPAPLSSNLRPSGDGKGSNDGKTVQPDIAGNPESRSHYSRVSKDPVLQDAIQLIRDRIAAGVADPWNEIAVLKKFEALDPDYADFKARLAAVESAAPDPQHDKMVAGTATPAEVSKFLEDNMALFRSFSNQVAGTDGCSIPDFDKYQKAQVIVALLKYGVSEVVESFDHFQAPLDDFDRKHLAKKFSNACDGLTLRVLKGKGYRKWVAWQGAAIEVKYCPERVREDEERKKRRAEEDAAAAEDIDF
jgi:hypothetical protein